MYSVFNPPKNFEFLMLWSYTASFYLLSKPDIIYFKYTFLLQLRILIGEEQETRLEIKNNENEPAKKSF